MLTEISQSQKDKRGDLHEASKIIHRRNPTSNSIHRDGKYRVVSRAWGKGPRSSYLINTEFCKMRKFWSSASNNGNILNTPEQYT